MEELLKVSDFSVQHKNKKILDSVNLSLYEREILALVGESGSGKSMLARSILKLNDEYAFEKSGQLIFEEKDIECLSERQMSKIRGNRIGMIFQEPLSYLNPVLKMKNQITEWLIKHRNVDKREALKIIIDLLKKMKIDNPEEYLNLYPHELSGGMAQRGIIAGVFSSAPRIIIADEPTSSLDVNTQLSIVGLLKEMSRMYGVSVIFITHDLDLAKEVSDRVSVMSRGKIVEEGLTEKIYNNPVKSETKNLLNAWDFKKEKSIREDEKLSIIKIHNLKKYYKTGKETVKKALDGIDINIYKGETLGILGESGCGKTTLARVLTRIQSPCSGKILYDGKDIFRDEKYHKYVQIIFQDPYSSLNPKMKVLDIVAEGIDIQKKYNHRERFDIVINFLEKVGLDESFHDRFPHQLSGGQRQRVSIARAIIVKPEVLICDEPTSYLDTISQKQVIELFKKLKSHMNLTCVFISHNIKVLNAISNRIAIIKQGKIISMEHK
ncbi:ABC transporter ATP-binding protein [Herbivorax sp. ANBcel31]|uniref:ATP-binding cassette domain-containing protein n=1 Tax=Herbivorax sp. ANBcel31 TaxID=3069754 RepID=UPI0027B33BFD|nr:ABC transporter ATP-binding protein [Herbivorax sp. ANBcel31]MDQ2085390.1 ABC transporter ATP-binding protein [Herbivorax sp. ANBcel31]